jgi:hypothetical protein
VIDLSVSAPCRINLVPELVAQAPEVESGYAVGLRSECLGNNDIEHIQRLAGLIDPLEYLADFPDLDTPKLDEGQFVVVNNLLEPTKLFSTRSIKVGVTCFNQLSFHISV